MLEGAISAVAALRVLRNSIEARFQQNEDFRVLKALDQVLAEIDPSTLPKVRQLQTVVSSAAASLKPGDSAGEQPAERVRSGGLGLAAERRNLPS